MLLYSILRDKSIQNLLVQFEIELKRGSIISVVGKSDTEVMGLFE